MDNHTTTAAAATANSANFSSSSSTTITDTAVTAAVDATHHDLHDPSLNHQNGTMTAATPRRRSLRQDLQSLLVTIQVTNTSAISSNISSSSPLLHATKPSREQLQEAAMLFQDQSLLPPLNLQGQGFFGYTPPVTTILIIVFLLVLYIHQYKTRQSKHHVLASYRLLVEKRAIHTAFVAVLSHPPRTIRRPRQRNRRQRRRHARSYSFPQQQQPQPNVHGNNGNHHLWRRTRYSLLQWQLFLYEGRHCCLDCWRQTWKSLTRGHASGLPLLLYNVHILWSCRGLEQAAAVSSSLYQPHYPYSSILDTHDDKDKDDILDNILFNSSNNYYYPLQYLRLLVALAFLTFGLELLTTHFLLQTTLLAEENPSSLSGTTTTTTATEDASSTLRITATDVSVVNHHPVNSSTNAGDDVSLSSYLYVGIPGPPLSSGGQRAEYQTRQQRESAQERKTFWRQSLLYKRMGTMTAITTALLWIHRAHFHGVNMAHAQYKVQQEYYQTQQEQVLQHQQQHPDEDESYDSSSDPQMPPTVNGDNLYPSFNVLPWLGNPSFLNAPTSATISLISYSSAIMLLLVLSRFSHPGWAVLCGSIVGILWGDMFPTRSHHGHVAMDGNNNNNQNAIVGGDSVDEGFLHFLAQPYYGDWLIMLLILFSLLSLKRTRKWSGWLPFIDFVAWGSSSTSRSSSNCRSTMTHAATANNDSGTCQHDQQQRQANLLRRGTRFMMGRNNEQEVFGFMDDDDHSHHGNDTDEDTESEASSQNENDDDDDDIFLVDNDTMERQHHQSFAPSLEVDNSDGGGEIYGRLPSLGDFLDEEDEGDGDVELALRMSLQQPQYNNARPS